MKKKFIALFLLSFFVLTVTNAEVKKKINKGGYYHEDGSYSFEIDSEMTPENSVLVYYTSGGLVEAVTYAQINPEKDPMLFPIKSQGMFGVCILPPVKPGSYLKVIEGSQKTSNTTYLYYDGLNLSYRPDIKVPNRPGLYFAGIFSELLPVSTYEEYLEAMEKGINVGYGIKNEKDFIKSITAQENACLKVLVKKYAGTDWEPLIKARMEELSK